MRDGLVDEQRNKFFDEVLKLANAHGAAGQVVVSDSSKGLATGYARTHSLDVLIMSLERFNLGLGTGLGMVIVARPSGGRTDEDKFLAQCADIVTTGTDYARFKGLVTNVVTMPSANSRLLQLADLVVSVTTAMVAGHTEFAGRVFPSVKSILRSNAGRIGGVGAKIHPDFSYANLYHWLFGDQTFGNAKLPTPNRPFPNDADVY